MVGFESTTSGFRTAVTRGTFLVQDANDSADLNSGRHGQFQEKENNADYWIEYFLSKIFFDEK